MTDKQKYNKGKAGQAGKWTANGFVPKPQPKKSITLWDIITGKA